MEAVAYQALVEGTCEPLCTEGAPQPCPYGEHCISQIMLCQHSAVVQNASIRQSWRLKVYLSSC